MRVTTNFVNSQGLKENSASLGDLKYLASLHQASVWSTLTIPPTSTPSKKGDELDANYAEEKKSSSSDLTTLTKSTNDLSLTSSSPAQNITPTHNSPFLTQNYINLLSETTCQAKVLYATDEWFARAENLLKDGPPIFVPDLYCEQGKVMDGWESRRRREAGHDFCVIKLGLPHGGNIEGIEIDTAHFTGNQAPRISIDVMTFPQDDTQEEPADEDDMYTWMPGAVRRLAQGGGIQGTGQSIASVTKAQKACDKFQWMELLPMTPLQPGYEETRMHYFPLSKEMQRQANNVTHVRVNYYPDGGVARLRLWGYPGQDKNQLSASGNDVDTLNTSIHRRNMLPPSAQPYTYPELSLSTNGGLGLECSNKHYGVPSNLIEPTYGKDMGDGWETARHPDRPAILVKDPVTNLVDSPLMDWAVLKLGLGGCATSGIQRIILDTKHFKGNYPESVMVEACYAEDSVSHQVVCSAPSSTSPTSSPTSFTLTPGQAGQEESVPPVTWVPLLPRTRMGADQEHVFDSSLGQLVHHERKITHVRVSIFPDGGLSRVRVYGEPAKSP